MVDPAVCRGAAWKALSARSLKIRIVFRAYSRAVTRSGRRSQHGDNVTVIHRESNFSTRLGSGQHWNVAIHLLPGGRF
jgi:hypothetical protein